ncbi:MAG: hypothetical protein GY705_21995, partial [Bacteroidetes bacterium]|nr:hypothetical protein [Bacteroidota bacterium]
PKVGDIVIINTPKVKRNHWPMARVTKIHKGDDGLVRGCDMRVSRVWVPNENKEDPEPGKFQAQLTTLQRPIQELVLVLSNKDLKHPLEIENSLLSPEEAAIAPDAEKPTSPDPSHLAPQDKLARDALHPPKGKLEAKTSIPLPRRSSRKKHSTKI